MKKIISLAAVAAFATIFVFGLSTPAFAPVDMFIKIDGIDGESSDRSHKGEIDVLSWSWGMSSSAGVTGERIMQPKMGAGTLTIVKTVDRSSPKLHQHCNSGEHVRSVEVAEGSRAYTLYDVRLECGTASGAAGDRPTEEIAFYYNKIQFQYDKGDQDSSKKKKRDKKK